MPYPYKKFRQNPFTSLRVIRRTDRQTDRTKNITSFFGGGNNAIVSRWQTSPGRATHDDYLVFIVEQNRVKIDVVVWPVTLPEGR